MSTLPIDAVLPGLLAVLGEGPNAVLIAPPGAGKTTRVAPALLDESWCSGEVLLLSPRRLAARAAAERMAQLADERVGARFGYATRLDTRRSSSTRVLVMTEGIFVNRIQDDPELGGVSAVLFDEVHERSLDTDFGLALALDAQAGLRPDLRILAMSATLDGARFASLMGGAPIIESEGLNYPLCLRYLGRTGETAIEDAVAHAIRSALREEDGGVLAFLPGVAEIERTAERLGGLGDSIVLHRLHGSLDPVAQRAAIGPADKGKRKVVLATSIAETSLTLDGIHIVVDSGLARRPRYDRAAGMTRLVTERASQAAVSQRAGRAARQGPGIAYRLWEDAATAGLPRFDPPEILEADLSALTLDCVLWGIADPRELGWLDPPPAAAIAEAHARLEALGALDADRRPTAHGRMIARLPLPPRLAHMLVEANRLGLAAIAAEVAVLLGERGLGGNDPDLETRRRRWRNERSRRADAARRLARRFQALATGRNEGADSPSTKRGGAAAIGMGKANEVGVAIALAFPERVARRRDPSGENWASVGGRGFRLDPTLAIARSEWLAVAETQGMAAGARILAAAPIEPTSIDALFGARVEIQRTVSFDVTAGAARAVRERRLGAIRLASGPDDGADPGALAAALVDGVRRHGLVLLPWGKTSLALRRRAIFAGQPLDDAALIAQLDLWLGPLVAGKRRLCEIEPGALNAMLNSLIGWDALQTIERLAPARFIAPTGQSHAIDYGAAAGPTVTLRPQELFGLGEHPSVGVERVPLILSLTSPAGRPIQTTRDLPGFWAGSWLQIAKEMRGRYPRHPWPDDPTVANATTRTKKADARRTQNG